MPSSKAKSSNRTAAMNPNSKLEEIQKKNLEIFKKSRIQSTDDSDEEETEIIDKSQVEALFRNYQGNETDVARITQFFESGENIDCLICIRQVTSKAKIWSCDKCFCCYHLLCIQKWANDSMNQKRIFYENQPAGYYSNSGVFVARKEIPITWDCPQCRFSYEPNEIPRHYQCYCGREREPLPQPFLIPHSCGEICNQPLEPRCGHRCLLLCHPGPHPDCAQIIHTTCKCQKSQIKTIRCSQQSWTCDKKCQKLLSCKVHKCEEICHDSCPPCSKSSPRQCACGNETKEIKCAQESWSCKKVCKKKFPCDLHSCERKCHAGDCGNCPFGLKRTCFCGKQAFIAESCEESLIESCGDTCLKYLACGTHRCMLRCHKGDCGACTELIEKKCRCGNFTKEHPCSKELLCETKCKNLKSCKKHACNRKCCIECSPCDKICSKLLSCGKHKCAALCHDGNCYPCTIKQLVKCRCGSTTISVLCGRWKKNRSPKCKEICKLPSKCHHEPLLHKCHAGDCISCTQVCAETLPCNHKCLASCHDYVKVVTKDKNFVATLPGDIAEEKVEMKKLNHPPCATKVPITCIGGHETMSMECHQVRKSSCGRTCNRKLSCGNHLCKKSCHPVANLGSDEQDENCEDCELPCMFDRPNGCTHPCPKNYCHQNACKRCQVQVKAKCFCGLTEVYYRCCDVNKRDLDDDGINALKLKYLSCGSRCIKNYPCGHQCLSNCHSGSCPEAEKCEKKVKLFCKCKTRKADLTCDKIRAEKLTAIPCDDNCDNKRKLAEEEAMKELKRQKQLEEEKNRRELAEYEKKFGKKKYKERKQKIVEEKKDNTSLIIGASAALVVIIAVVAYFLMFN